MRAHHLLMLAAAALCNACFDNPSGEYPQRLVGCWHMAGKVMGEPADGMLYIMREGDYILENRESARVALIAPSGAGHWFLLRDQLELMTQEVSPISGIGPQQAPHRLYIVSLDQDHLVTSDADYGVKIEWVRVGPLN